MIRRTMPEPLINPQECTCPFTSTKRLRASRPWIYCWSFGALNGIDQPNCFIEVG
ncbi:Uncharacterized protein TCM_019922 [Theobroma cacao]|uniref:Uncharacterized protein n=1 Tax=Theobroma cacao TaxID=3641 RepID=A0A061EIC0_THECC|nr:Uncharacterized protein TCM_019922 [Theobroma cacao]